MRSSTLVASALLVAALCVAGAGAFPVKQGEEEGATIQALREDITNPAVKSAFVGKFNKAKRSRDDRMGDQAKKSASHSKLSKKDKGDTLTASGHQVTVAPEDEAQHFMSMLPWILPIVCLSILVIVAVSAKMCQAGNYKHTQTLKEGGVQPSFKYGGPIGAGPM
mmetsp:Transcript_65226/g.155579  ORF Transcript_65226/g.155579 Transcript_65226/m.155579 type:complete len:165 (+) Transcript_65226:66-560(+)|eukprot:CAMPEP_0180139604 /NCGR_PEP_ID=MMETSP0986-20121125/13651_1 /TAXON_ID=697907 /ORGANISM="non described non described, Strain CCMP2293" /LENGTH=164 /DNA_ID=CAMNT_0022081777 /DNA_START=117 /DNA_END=611 /DNA_ORIENTATION=+